MPLPTGDFQKKLVLEQSGVDIDIIKGNNSVELTEQAPSIQKFAKHVDKSWEDYTGYIGKYGRIPFEALVDIAGQAKSSNENIGKSDMEEVELSLIHI